MMLARVRTPKANQDRMKERWPGPYNVYGGQVLQAAQIITVWEGLG